MAAPLPTIAILGASGLIGQAVAAELMRDGFPVVAIARSFTPAQKAMFADKAVECLVLNLTAEALSALFEQHAAEVIVNCIGTLQDSPQRGKAEDVHVGFVSRLTKALKLPRQPRLLVHLSVPGNERDDRTAFSTTKRQAEKAIAESGVPHVILRPGFVIAPAAYGGSALVRALAALPIELSERELQRPFATTDMADIAGTITDLGRRWSGTGTLLLQAIEIKPDRQREKCLAQRARAPDPQSQQNGICDIFGTDSSAAVVVRSRWAITYWGL